MHRCNIFSACPSLLQKLQWWKKTRREVVESTRRKKIAQNEKLFTLSGRSFFLLDRNIRNRFLFCSFVMAEMKGERGRVCVTGSCESEEICWAMLAGMQLWVGVEVVRVVVGRNVCS
jgi:hypothetical protein